MPSYTSGGTQAPPPEEKKVLPPPSVASGYSSTPLETYYEEAPAPTVTEPSGYATEPQGQNDVLWNVEYQPENDAGRRVVTPKTPDYLPPDTTIPAPYGSYPADGREGTVRGSQVTRYPTPATGSTFPGRYPGDKNYDAPIPLTPDVPRTVLQTEAARTAPYTPTGSGAVAPRRLPSAIQEDGSYQQLRQVRPGMSDPGRATEPAGDNFAILPSQAGDMMGPGSYYLRDSQLQAQEDAENAQYLESLKRNQAWSAGDYLTAYGGDVGGGQQQVYQDLLPGYLARQAAMEAERAAREAQAIAMFPGLFGSGKTEANGQVIIPDPLFPSDPLGPVTVTPHPGVIPPPTLLGGRHITYDQRKLPPQVPYITTLPNSPTKNGTR